MVSQLLDKYQLTAKKQLGQNFLTDANTLQKIVAAAELDSSDLVVEIGAGIGTLTNSLAERAGLVVTVETDRSLAPLLEEVLTGHANVRIIYGDILKLDPLILIEETHLKPKVVANLPYYITTPILFHLLESGIDWRLLVFLVQKEVAQRMVSPPGNKIYGALSVMIQHYCHAEIIGIVPPTVFLPRPKVDSAIVRLIPRKRETNPQTERLFSLLVRTSFAYRRKNLFNSLRRIFSDLGGEKRVEEAFQVLGINPKQRGETLSPEEFYALASYLAKN